MDTSNVSKHKTPPAAVLPRLMLGLFCLPAVMQSFVFAPTTTLVQGMYGKYFGLSLTAMGTGYLISRIFDAVTDPLIGHASDIFHHRTGTRKPFILAGAVLGAFAVWKLYQPPEDPGFWYFTGWFMLTYLAWTLIEIPYRAWSVELTHDYGQRTRISAWILVFSLLGGVVFYVIPQISVSLGYATSTAITPQTFVVAAVVAVFLLPAIALLVTSTVPNGEWSPKAEHDSDSLSDIMVSIFKNGPLMRLSLTYLIFGCGGGTVVGIMFFFVDGYLKLGDQLALVLLITMPMMIIAAPFWSWACVRFEKHRAAAVGLGLGGLVYAAQGFLTPGDGVLLHYLILSLLGAFFIACIAVALPAMLGDVVDYGIFRFGHDRAGVYYSIYTMLTKSVGAAGTAIGLFIVDWAGFDATATEQTASGILGLKLAYAVIPGLSLSIAAPLLWRYSLTRRRHAAVLYAIAKREARGTAEAKG